MKYHGTRHTNPSAYPFIHNHIMCCNTKEVVTVCTELAEEVRGHVTHTDSLNLTADISMTRILIRDHPARTVA